MEGTGEGGRRRTGQGKGGEETEGTGEGGEETEGRGGGRGGEMEGTREGGEGTGGQNGRRGVKNTLLVFFLSMNSLGSFLFCLNPLLSQKKIFFWISWCSFCEIFPLFLRTSLTTVLSERNIPLVAEQ